MGLYSPPQPHNLPLYQPAGGTHPIQYQPGKYPMPNQPVPVTWMPAPGHMPNCPPGLEYLTQVLHTNPSDFLMKYDWGPDQKSYKAGQSG